MRPIHLHDTPATTPEHRAHIARIAAVYRPRTEARRRCQEMREAREMTKEQWGQDERDIAAPV